MIVDIEGGRGVGAIVQQERGARGEVDGWLYWEDWHASTRC